MEKPSESQVELETKIAFLERTCEELGEVILGQGNALEALSLRVQRMEARASAGPDGGEEEESLADQRPPHY